MTTVRPFDPTKAVLDRYTAGAAAREAELCCPVEYDPAYLDVIPEEILERDYGCGDPTRYIRPGDTVLDLGSGSGKHCYIASQVVGPHGRVIGVDMNPEMLALARKYKHEVGARIGWHNVVFRRGRIEDLALDLDLLDEWLATHPVAGADDVPLLEAAQERLREEAPLIESDSVDVVISNCVLNLVNDSRKADIFPGIFRVLRRGGRVVISDIVTDEPVPEKLKRDPDLWSGCISGAMTETEFVQAFEQAGFYGIEILKRGEQPWRTIEGVEFRSVTVRAFKGKEGACYETNKAVIYRGPFRQVVDDDGHVFRRGERAAVCEKTFRIMISDPYQEHFDQVLPLEPVAEEDAAPFDCSRTAPRHPRETKGLDYDVTTDDDPRFNCAGGECC